MTKNKRSDDTLRNRKSRSPKRDDQNNKGTPHAVVEKPRIRRTHRKGHYSFFGDIGSEFCKRLFAGLLVFCCVLAVLYFGVNYNRAADRQRKVFTPINLPNVIAPNETAPDHNPELYWGTYRPSIFFGMSHRSPHSMLFGLAWVAFDGETIALRHKCINEGNMKRYLRGYNFQLIMNMRVTISKDLYPLQL